MAVPSFEELERMGDQELIELHDREAPNTQVGVNYFLAELARRQQARQTDAMLNYTWWITWMTFIVTVATAVQLTLAAITHFKQ